MPIQLRDGMRRLYPAGLPTDYADVAKVMARYYLESGELKGAALANIKAMIGIAKALGFSRVIQIEGFPWHSSTLPNKRALQRDLAGHPAYAEYDQVMRNILKASPVVLSWSAGRPEIRSGNGVEFKAELMGLELERANLIALGRKKTISQGLIWQKDSSGLRGLFVRTGSAGLPKNKRSNGGQLYDAIAGLVADGKNVGRDADFTAYF
jgi:hypothetical protein